MKHLTILITLLTAALGSHAQSQPAMKLWYDKPATYFEESLPIGNGKLGAAIHGGVDDNIIYLNDITFWTGKPVDRNLNADTHQWIPKIREALFAENYPLADSLQRYVQGPRSSRYLPLATLHIRDLGSGAVSDYRRELDIDNAICRDQYCRGGINYFRDYFASHPGRFIAIRICAGQKGAVNCKLTLTSLVPHQVRATGNQLTLTGHAPGDPNDVIHTCTMLHVKAKGGHVVATDTTLTVKGADEAILYIVNNTSYNGFDKHPVTEGAPYAQIAADDLRHAIEGVYTTQRSKHMADYRRYYTRFALTLGHMPENPNSKPTDVQLTDYTRNKGGNPYLETLYTQYGRYLLISCSRTPGVPANLQGLWNPHFNAPWSSNYTVNINLEENYWPAEVTNLPELTMPLFSLMENLAENGRAVAQNYYGVSRGSCSCHNSDLWALANPIGNGTADPMWANWNMGLAWLTQALWEHYAFTGDKLFLRTQALPLMERAAAFVCDWLIENPAVPGQLFTAPSTSPENMYRLPNRYSGRTCYGGAADMAIIRELFNNTMKSAKIVGKKSKLIDEIKEKSARLMPYRIGQKGDLNEWYHDWNDRDIHHRHQSHLIGLYPGHHITPAHTPELAEACRQTLIQKGDETTGWSTGWRTNLWARLGDGEQAYHIFQKLLQYTEPDGAWGNRGHRSGGTYPNLFDAHPPFQIDGNFGGTAGVCEMLVQSSCDEIVLLPAIPAAWSEGSVSGLCARGGFEIDMQWKDGKVTAATIRSRMGGKTTIKYNGTQKTIKVKKGGHVTL